MNFVHNLYGTYVASQCKDKDVPEMTLVCRELRQYYDSNMIARPEWLPKDPSERNVPRPQQTQTTGAPGQRPTMAEADTGLSSTLFKLKNRYLGSGAAPGSETGSGSAGPSARPSLDAPASGQRPGTQTMSAVERMRMRRNGQP